MPCLCVWGSRKPEGRITSTLIQESPRVPFTCRLVGKVTSGFDRELPICMLVAVGNKMAARKALLPSFLIQSSPFLPGLLTCSRTVQQRRAREELGTVVKNRRTT